MQMDPLGTFMQSLPMIIENLKANFLGISKQFHEILKVTNLDKCHFMVLGDPNYTCNLKCNAKTMKCSKEEKVLDVTSDDKLN